MFYANSKIAVIASNATAKSSPRVGSLGYVGAALNRNMFQHTAKPQYDAFQVQVIFYRYGFQRVTNRLEEKWCQVLVPRDFPERVKPVNFANKLIKETKNTVMLRGQPTIVAVPMPVQAPANLHETIASIAAMTRSYSLKNNYISFVNQDYQSDRLRNKDAAFVSQGANAVRQIILGQVSRRKLPELVKNTFEFDKNVLRDFLFVLNTIRSLHIKHENELLLNLETPYSPAKYINDESKTFATMFQDVVFKEKVATFDWLDWLEGVKEAYEDRAKKLISDN